MLAQNNQVLAIGEVHPVTVARGQTAEETLTFYLRPGYHVNSNKPNDEYLIPIRLTWTGPLRTSDVAYPAPHTEKSDFRTSRCRCTAGPFASSRSSMRRLRLRRDRATMAGKLRYQACNDHECLRPQTINVQAAVEVK